MKRVRLTALAEQDIQTAFVWYERERENLGVRFLDRVEEAVGVISRNPEAPQQVMTGVRHVGLKKFPYSLWYTVAREVLVIGCLYGKRSPNVAVRRARVAEPKPKRLEP